MQEAATPTRPTEGEPREGRRPSSGRMLTEEAAEGAAAEKEVPAEAAAEEQEAEAANASPRRQEAEELATQQAAVRVCIRLRPLLAWEKDQGHAMTKLRVSDGAVVASEKVDRTFRFDDVFGPETPQEAVFERSNCAALVGKVVEGFAATVFAYGQTGSGKTYTIDGAGFTAGDGKDVPTTGAAARRPGEEELEGTGSGIVLRAVSHLFREVQAARAVSGDTITVKVSFLQIYNERVYDLLNPAHLRLSKEEGQGAHPGLRLRWTPQAQFHVENLFVYEVRNATEVLHHFRAGSRNKAVGSHKLNFASSRSHSVLQLYVERNADQALRMGRLSLVDLAGSERVAKTAVEGQALREAININQSLFVLRKVIASLASPKEADHIPYRESKLTSLLKQSFGGNSYTVMLACLSPADAHFEDNVSTLQYATKARAIRNAPQVLLDPKSALILKLQSEVKDLRRRLSDAHAYIVSLTGSLPEYLRSGKKLADAARARAASEALETARPAIERRIEERKEEKPAEAPAEREDTATRPADAEDKAEKEKPKQARPVALRQRPAAAPAPEWARFDVQTLGERLTESVRVLGDAVQENQKLRAQMETMAAATAKQSRMIEELTRENCDLRENAAYLEAAATAERGSESITKLSTIHDSLLFQVLALRKEHAALQRRGRP